MYIFNNLEAGDLEGIFSKCWDSFNIADVRVQEGEATIKLNTTILIEMDISGHTGLTGFLKKSVRLF